MAHLQPEFTKRNVKILGLSVDPVTSHSKWAADIEETQGAKVNFPMIGDPQLTIAKLYGMLPAESGSTSEGRTAADNATVRTVFVVGPDKKIKLQLSYPMSTGRNFDEILRVIDSIQLTAKHKVSTPANWKQGDDVIIGGNVSNEEAQKLYPGGWKTQEALYADCSAAEITGALTKTNRPRIFTDRTRALFDARVPQSVGFALVASWKRMCPVIVPVFKSKKLLRMNGLRMITGHITRLSGWFWHPRASRIASKFSTCPRFEVGS